MKAASKIFVFTLFACIFQVQGQNLTIQVSSQPYKIVTLSSGDHEIQMEGFVNRLVPGEPKLPAKIFMIALPPSAEVTSVTVTGREPVELAGMFRIPPASAPMPSEDRPCLVKSSQLQWKKARDAVYGSNNPYPGRVGEYAGSGSLRKYRYVRVVFNPFQYQPLSGKLMLYKSADVSIDYTVETSGEHRNEALLQDTQADVSASRLFINYEDARRWYRSGRLYKGQNNDLTNYVIITTENLESAVSSFVLWKQSLGFSVKVVTISWIAGQYSGFDLAETIRNFLIDTYGVWGIQYVLIVGDIADIPMRTCYTKSYGSSEYADYITPTDAYYADLTGDWDSDGDGYFGEYSDDDVDFMPEVIVGRIPWSDPASVAHICQKIIDYESDTGSWKDSALLMGAMSNFTDEDHDECSKTDGAVLMNEMISDMMGGWSTTTLFEKEGLEISGYACDYPLTHSNAIAAWSSGDYGIVNWWAHGNRYAAYRVTWAWDDGDGIPETKDPDEINSEAFVSRSDTSSLDDSHPALVFSCSCLNGYPEDNNLAKALLKRGAAGVIASTRVSWYNVGWDDKNDGGNASIDYYFFYYLIQNHMPVGSALDESKIHYLNHFFWWGAASQQNMMDFCLYGDPSLIRSGTSGVTKILSVTPSIEWDFGEVPSGGFSEKAFLLANIGTDAIQVTSLGLGGENTAAFSLQSPLNVPFSISPGDTQRVVVRFQPTNPGPKTALLLIDNDSDNVSPTKSVILRGIQLLEPQWAVPLSIVGDGVEMIRTFGGEINASEGYNAGLDVITPPPSQTTYAYFHIGSFPYYLSTDIREWASPFDRPMDWTLKIVNADEISTTISWDQADLPSEGKFTFIGASSCDMRTTDSLTFVGDRTLTIQYRPLVTLTYEFPQAGWYMVSLPVTPADSNLNALFPTALGAYDWDAVGETYNGVTAMEPKRGYWLAIPDVTSDHVYGQALTNYTTHFYSQGWYMIGSVMGGADFTNPDDDPDGMVFSPAFGYDPLSHSYVQTNTLNEKEGYWVAVFGECDLTVGEGSGGDEGKRKNISRSLLKTNWSAFASQYGSSPPAPPNVNWETGDLATIPTEYGLAQNYPNPFNPETMIEYRLPKDGRVTLIIYNMMGQVVRRLVDEEKRAGYYKVAWNGRSDSGIHVGTGIYLLQLRAGSFTQIRKLLLVQ